MDAPATSLHRLTYADRRLARRSPEVQEFVERLAREPGIATVVFDAFAGTLLVAYDPDLASRDRIRDRLREEGLQGGPPRDPLEREALDLLLRFGPALPRIAAVTVAILRV